MLKNYKDKTLVDKLHKYLFYFTLFSGFFFLALMEVYQAILFVLLVMGFMLIVMKNKKYEYLIQSIEKFF